MRIGLILFFFGLVMMANGQDIKVMTYNLRLDLKSDGVNAWPKRKNILVQQLRNNAPDILGTQEGLPHQIEFINKELPNYSFIGVPRDDGKAKGEYSNIFYNKKRVKVLSQNTIWLSKTPKTPSKGWDAAYPRICTYGLFQELKSGNKFWVFNTHFDHVGKKARCKSVKLIRKTIKQVNGQKLPVVFMGDLNLTPDTKEIKKLSKKFVDTYSINPPMNGTTFNDFKNFKGPRIDYIFVSKGVDVKRYSILVEQVQGCFPSDHFPVVSEISIGQPTDYQLVWADEFDQDGLPDTTKWNYRKGDGCPSLCGFGNREAQWYSDARLKNTRIESGVLLIEAHHEDIGSRHYSSARLNSIGKGEWQYGKYEIRAKLPGGLGVWPAIWMLGVDCRSIKWPDCGEIDIMEHVGYHQDSISGTVHTGAYNHIKNTQRGKYYKLPTAETQFHVYGLTWSPEKLDFSVDGEVYLTFKNEHAGIDAWPYDRPFYMVLNLAVGGGLGGKYGVDDNIWPQRLEVDYVRVFQKMEHQGFIGHFTN